jgi:hypothetical protein
MRNAEKQSAYFINPTRREEEEQIAKVLDPETKSSGV